MKDPVELSRSNFNLRSPDAYLVISYLITAVQIFVKITKNIIFVKLLKIFFYLNSLKYEFVIVSQVEYGPRGAGVA